MNIISYDAMNVSDLSAASKMVLPPVEPKSTDITDWVTLTAYSRGDIVRNATTGILYWAYVAGTTGATAPTHVDGDAADGTVTWRYVRPRRNTVEFVNSQDVEIYLCRGNAAAADKGILLTTNGSSFTEGMHGGPQCFQGAWYAWAQSGSANVLAIQEG